MANIKPSIPKGMRDFSPSEMIKRNYIFEIIKNCFGRYGFLPLETPAMENLNTLTGKYGEEGDRLIFKVLNSGNYLEKVDTTQMESTAESARKILPLISEKALRYDLTVPFARYVVMHKHEISFPFKRYQIQPVWRADRPQKGRYREFYQCDADIIGSNSLFNEFELVQILDEVFTKLNLRVTIKVNNRKILSGIAEYIGASDKITDITVAIDKLDKIGLDKVVEELVQKGLSSDALEKIKPLLHFKPITAMGDETCEYLNQLTGNTATGKKGIEELKSIFDMVMEIPLHSARFEFDITLARGLNYYTGAIFEVKLNEPSSNFTGSLSGGGRYDDLTGIFGLPGLSGVGISFGADRIYDVLEELKLFPESYSHGTKAMLANFGETYKSNNLKLLFSLRQHGISAIYYPEEVKMKKQFEYADSLHIPYVVIIGEEEVNQEKVSVKNMKTGTQEMITISQLTSRLKSNS
ncbi:MAG: histidine--tRNA ligase [Bacteroidia bacterium]|nr:histidine--tRNA ligase [Bacteroidia bacterium]MCZ2249633.1 histidine--tRNA ligase [Bacteroidia bacterium]